MLIGLVGKPNVGKSTFFKAATLAEVAIAPYPFTTLEKNEGVGFVRVDCVEREFKVRCKPRYGYCVNGTRFIPIRLIDVAGLVPGAHSGRGRGNLFLDHLREADLLIHVLDASGTTTESGEPTSGYDPAFDVRFLVDEIDLWIHGILNRNWSAFARKAGGAGKELHRELARLLSGLKITEEQVKAVMNELSLSKNPLEWRESHLLEFARAVRSRSKPIIVAANKADRPESKANIDMLKESFPDLTIVPCSAESELALREAAKTDLISYLPGDSDFTVKGKLTEKQESGLDLIRKSVLKVYGNTGVQQALNEAVFSKLGYIVAYPVENESKLSDKEGNILPDAYLLPPGSTALDLAYSVHTDIGKTFVSAIDVRTKRRLGKEAELKSNDVIKILTRS